VQAPIQCRPARAESFAQHLESIDVSFGGLRLRSDEEYRVGAFLRLDIFFAPRAPVTLTAEVVWIEALSQGAHARFDVGLAFVELNNDALKFLMSVLDSEVEQVPAPVDSSVEFNRDEAVSEVRPVTPAPGNAIVPDTYAPRVCAPPPARGPDDGDRPTVPPPFDLQAFAHETTARYPEPVAPCNQPDVALRSRSRRRNGPALHPHYLTQSMFRQAKERRSVSVTTPSRRCANAFRPGTT
jgi:PilZ domain-containing protein